MKIGPNERYEIKAEAFRIITGHMAPGKDAPSAAYPAPYEERAAIWESFWTHDHITVADAMILAMSRLFPDDED